MFNNPDTMFQDLFLTTLFVLITIIASVFIYYAYAEECVSVLKYDESKIGCFFPEHAPIVVERGWGTLYDPPDEDRVVIVGFPNNANIQPLVREHASIVASFNPSILDKFPDNEKLFLAVGIENFKSAVHVAKQRGYEYVGYDAEKGFLEKEGLLHEWQDSNGRVIVHESINKSCDYAHENGIKCMVGSSRPSLQHFYSNIDWSNVDVFLIPLQKTTGSPEYESLGQLYGGFARAQNPNLIIASNVNVKFCSIDCLVSEAGKIDDITDGISVISFDFTPAQFVELVEKIRR